jgi:hypothetical protein
MATIYGIRCLTTGEVYVGSTIDYQQRQSVHKVPKNSCCSKQIIERGNYEFYIIEECDVEQKLIREKFHIENTMCINKLVPFRTKEERQKYKQKWHEEHKEEIKKHYEENKDDIARKHKLYRDSRKEELNKKSNQYNEEHKEQIKQKRSEIIQCECGYQTAKGNLPRHRKTTKHRENMIKNKIAL